MWSQTKSKGSETRGRNGRGDKPESWLFTCTLGAVLATLLTWAALNGQVTRTDEVIVTANATPVPFKNLSRTVQILTRREIETLPVRSVSDLLGYATSVDVRSRGPAGIQSDFSIRGSTFGQVLVLIDGVRLNSSQTGHHNSDFPVSLADIDRVEILYGASSSLHGGDALAGTINIVTRKDRSISSTVSVGQFGFFSAQARLPLSGQESLPQITAWVDRSSGFEPTRDFQHLGIRLTGSIAEKTRYTVSHASKDFGANGFYGPSPSREWTDITLISLDDRREFSTGWQAESQIAFRSHGDHFLWDERRPGFAENRHREFGIEGGLQLHRLSAKTRLSVGSSVSTDWIGSSNLGDRAYERLGAFVELERFVSEDLVVYPSLRLDKYSDFGSSLNPSISGSWWFLESLRLRSSVGRAFRIPTFTERFYTDPNHEASSDLDPEIAWSAETGLDWFPHHGWSVSTSLFSRLESGAIDWVRETPEQRWRTTNIRELSTRGVETSLQRIVGNRARVTVSYTYLNSRVDELPLLSKYTLEYPRHSLSFTASHPVPGGFELGSHAAFKRRLGDRSHWVLDTILHRRIGPTRFFFEVSNLFNEEYQEIAGVDMPPRWIRIGLDFFCD